MNPLWGGPGKIHAWMKILPTRVGYCLNTNYACRFRCEDTNVTITHVQLPHYYRVWQVEPCHQLG